EFVIIFDADFIPYADTITQFLKYFKAATGRLNSFQDYYDSKTAAIQGYQWHVLNKSENWVTRGVRSEFAGSYVMERSGNEIFGGLKMIAGSVYMIRRDVLQTFGWGTSITEDFQLTLKIYEAGYKVVYTPYIQAPSECVSTVKRLIRQRMRWAEGHSFNVKKMFGRLLRTPYMNVPEKVEFLYLSPYYLQSFFFIVGTLAWFLSEAVFHARLPFWTALWGWSLVFSNMLSLPLMNSVGLFLEEAEEKDFLGLISFVGMSYLLVPFQAYASVKGLLEEEEGGWFRTPKSGKITDTIARGTFYRWLRGLLPRRRDIMPISQVEAVQPIPNLYISLRTAQNSFQSFSASQKVLPLLSPLNL
ncbi:MAG TPA: glycosyltransferase family 2 protein, partial [Candidatus Hodarchaeales archaeon]|nr:glycosyltransferase family 2 protein [Candidatus Hodarchaeales archaeon]